MSRDGNLSQPTDEIPRCQYLSNPPFRRIPAELWTEIFFLSLPDFTGLKIGFNSFHTLGLSHVCSFWHAVAIGTPKLWSSICIDLAHSRFGLRSVVALYLDRSGAGPLRLRLGAGDMPLDGLSPTGWGAMEMLLAASGRWLTAELELPWDILNHGNVQNALTTIPGHCEMLQSLKVVFGCSKPYRAFDERSPSIFRLVEKAPHLRSLHLDDFHKSFRLPFFQLHEITITNFTGWDDILDFLSCCPNLRKVDFVISHFLNLHNDQIPQSLNILPILHSLRCRWSSIFHGIRFLPILVLPALTVLDLIIPKYGDKLGHVTELGQNLQDLLLRSSCQLDVLKLRGNFYSSDQELHQILSLIPSLSQLFLESYHCRAFTDSFFQTFTLHEHSHHGSGLLPRLRSFHIGIDESSISSKDLLLPDPEVILSMVQSRRTLSTTDVDAQGRTSLSFFGFDVHFNLNVRESRVSVKDWADSFCDIAEPGLLKLAEGGLKMELKLRASIPGIVTYQYR